MQKLDAGYVLLTGESDSVLTSPTQGCGAADAILGMYCLPGDSQGRGLVFCEGKYLNLGT